MTILLLAALLPPLYLMLRIYRLDKIESEPRGLVLRVFLSGAIAVVPAVFLEFFGGAALAAFIRAGRDRRYWRLANWLSHSLRLGCAHHAGDHAGLLQHDADHAAGAR